MGLKIGDIISAYVKIDENNISKYKFENYSYIVEKIQIISKRTEISNFKFSIENLKKYSEAKNRVRNFLNCQGYIDLTLPILTDAETSSMAESFVTQYHQNSKKIFLRKSMDPFLRILSCYDIDKIYSIGPCFRAGFVTKKNQPEFEMLSIFTNNMTRQVAMQFSKKILELIINKRLIITEIKNKEYIETNDKKGIYLITDFPNEINSYANEIDSDTLDEFKIKIDGITVIHGVKEIENIDKYINKVNLQGKRGNYGELTNLEKALRNGAPVCYNIGISIVRILAVFYDMQIKDFNLFPFSRIKIKEKVKK